MPMLPQVAGGWLGNALNSAFSSAGCRVAPPVDPSRQSPAVAGRSGCMEITVKTVRHPVRKARQRHRASSKVLRIKHAGEGLLPVNIETDADQPAVTLAG